MPKPKVLIVDDLEADREREAIARTDRVDVEAAYPEEVNASSIEDVDLVLVDYDLRDWVERDGIPLARRPANGLALIPILRESLREKGHAPPGFAILTSELGQLSNPFLPEDYREHVLARLHDMEWAFSKDDDARGPKIAALASAIQGLPRRWPDDHDTAFRVLGEYLNAPDFEANDGDPIYRAISRCNPPVHDYSKSSGGISVLRWLLHRILPYPTFLSSLADLAERIGVDPVDLRPALQEGQILREALEPLRYQGALAGFFGDRWWSDKVEAWFWDISEGQSPTPLRLRTALLKYLGVDLPESKAGSRGVLTYNARLRPKDLLRPIDECRRIEPDDWPPFARYAHAERSDIEEIPLLRLVVSPKEED